MLSIDSLHHLTVFVDMRVGVGRLRSELRRRSGTEALDLQS